MRSQKSILIEQLDRKLQPFSAASSVIIPDGGWIHTIRTSINMTLNQLGKKLGITKQGAKKIEESEAAGTITLKSLIEAGRAMEMKLVYGFVPNDGSVDLLIERMCRSLAEKIIQRTHQTMVLEDQAIEQDKINVAIEELSKEIRTELNKSIWD